MDELPKDAGQEEDNGRLICGAWEEVLELVGQCCVLMGTRVMRLQADMLKRTSVGRNGDKCWTPSVGVLTMVETRRRDDWSRSGYVGVASMVWLVSTMALVESTSGRLDDGTEGTDVEVPLVPQRWVRHAQMQVSFVRPAVVSSTLCRRESVDFCQVFPQQCCGAFDVTPIGALSHRVQKKKERETETETET